MKHKLRYTLSAVILFLLIAITGGAFYLVNYALEPDSLAESHNIQGSLERQFKKYPHLVSWVDSLQQASALGDLYLENEDGWLNHAIYVAGARPTSKTAVIVHGYTNNAIDMLMIGYLYNQVLGYNILLPDLHAHGLSQGKAIQMGWKDRLDVLQWIEKAEEIFSRTDTLMVDNAQTSSHSVPTTSKGIQVVVHGISMGAATTMMVAGEVEQGMHQLPYVKCFVADCGYTSVWDEFEHELNDDFNLPAFPILHIASYICQQKYGWNFKEASALNQVKKSSRPMLFIHGDEDDYVPTSMVYPLYEAKPAPKELWLVPKTNHANSYKNYRKEYTKHVRDFVEKYITCN